MGVLGFNKLNSEELIFILQVRFYKSTGTIFTAFCCVPLLYVWIFHQILALKALHQSMIITVGTAQIDQVEVEVKGLTSHI